MKLNNNQKLFCQEYVKKGRNGTKAYLASYKCKNEETARVNASRLLTNANIMEYIEKLQSEVKEKSLVSIEEIINELKILAFTDRTNISKMIEKEIIADNVRLATKVVDFAETKDLSIEEKKLIAGYKMTQNGCSVEIYDKLKALEMLGKYLGIWTDNVNNTPSRNYEEYLKQISDRDEY